MSDLLINLLTGLGLPEEFHFLRPVWLWGIPVTLVAGMLLFFKRSSTRWEDVIPADILEALRVTGGASSNLWKWVVPVAMITACIAAAGPTWKKIPVPTSQDQSALVILLDLSPSMLATDLAPDRLTRVKYKLIDILRARGDGQTALIAYAGSPHRVAPLTDDTATIESLLPALHPLMMPVQGSNPEAAVELALSMLQSAGATTGNILLITDGVAPDAQRTINDLIPPGYRLSVLGVGSTDAVPIPKPGGGFVSDGRGEIVLTELNRNELQILAGFHRGRYVELQSDDSDVRYLLQEQNLRPEQSNETLETVYDSWEDVGYVLVLLLIPLAAYSFRRGLIFCMPLIALPLALTPQKSEALEWQDLWKTPDQQAAGALATGDAETAAAQFEDPRWAAYAQYRNQDYTAASSLLEGTEESLGASDHYNAANALALNGELEEAIQAYDRALALEPGMEDAEYNKAVIEQLLEQQQNQQQDQESESSDSQENSQSQDADQSQNSEQSENPEESENSGQPQSQDQSDADQEQNDSESQQNQNPSEPEESDQQQPGETNQEASAQSEEAGQEQQSEPQEAQEQETEQENEQEATGLSLAEETPEALDPASEQFLRAIPDDPSGLLRRKFEYESEAYQREQRFMRTPPGNEDEVRY